MNYNKNSTRYYSSRQEKSVADKLGGKVTANSGAAKFSGGDVRLENWLIECKTKTTQSNQISIKKEWLEKIKEEAYEHRKDNCALCFNFGLNTENYYIISEQLMKWLVDNIQG